MLKLTFWSASRRRRAHGSGQKRSYRVSSCVVNHLWTGLLGRFVLKFLFIFFPSWSASFLFHTSHVICSALREPSVYYVSFCWFTVTVTLHLLVLAHPFVQLIELFHWISQFIFDCRFSMPWFPFEYFLFECFVDPVCRSLFAFVWFPLFICSCSDVLWNIWIL